MKTNKEKKEKIARVPKKKRPSKDKKKKECKTKKFFADFHKKKDEKANELTKIATEIANGDVENKEKTPGNTKKDTVVKIKDFNFFYNKGKKQALFDINMDIKENTITTFIGPSGCGKSTLLRAINRMNDLVDGSVSQGEIEVFDKNIYAPGYDVTELRTDVGMVFQKANPFPTSIFENVAYGPKSQGVKDKNVLKQLVQDALEKSALWEEVKDNLNGPALGLSGGQQQRLCIARAIAMHPKILLMDEPTSALDPIATLKVEELVLSLKKDYTIIMVTHSMAQATRISNYTGFFLKGELVEFSKTKKMFTNPKDQRTEDYISGRFSG
ncbi:phosphate ABC transporter ATP-binding protein PstB [Mesoplasma lactucae]|uniref:Phosphate ABC transporter ATP-binding protein n=1 Tax=Mesoplasma lactucae ATCC 49193 TaxID=81460 RepID=A0A291IS61_9MOLU|nr:phosphate ABC transporter ATP-binding protein [Mesoplasma lactucae ATCC 49193]ATZ20016.1 phosphate ABC transporter ATP-binding protein [Mesoplasma lactucae ATCC 49193]MCL8217033.1 Vitamin B12 import ATP-binding protein BtuD [Mesoplasma lactucae ATCC 49193]